MQQNSKYPPEIDSVIFDLDGVITQTRKTHKKAWKEVFDQFFEKHGNNHTPLTEEDYLEYIDGRPRYQGVKSFLLSRGIELPFGSPHDKPGFKTICALGNVKNDLFNEMLDREGVEVYQDALKWLVTWKGKGVKTAIVSSSKNCKKIVKTAEIEHLFDVRVDGLFLEEIGLSGKPHPGIFLEATKRLKARPGYSVVFEDTISGVKAGQQGYFGLVAGVNRFNNKEALIMNGADIVLDNFSELDLSDQKIREEFFSFQGTPVFPDNVQEIIEKFRNNKPAFFLDYDGTLTPIVSKPEEAVISDEMKNTLTKVAEKFTVAIVTGRDKDDVENLVGLDDLIYAGSHGYIITGPGGLFMEHPDSKKILPKLDEVEKVVEERLKERTKGTQIDRKRYAIGLHFRNARPEDEKVVHEIVDEIIDKYPGHKKGEGKKIVEIKPDIDWHKGKAVQWIMDALGFSNKESVIPVFIGDDITDEDAFEALKEKGIGILVGSHGQKTFARYSLKNVFQVREFFGKLLDQAFDKK